MNQKHKWMRESFVVCFGFLVVSFFPMRLINQSSLVIFLFYSGFSPGRYWPNWLWSNKTVNSRHRHLCSGASWLAQSLSVLESSGPSRTDPSPPWSCSMHTHSKLTQANNQRATHLSKHFQDQVPNDSSPISLRQVVPLNSFHLLMCVREEQQRGITFPFLITLLLLTSWNKFLLSEEKSWFTLQKEHSKHEKIICPSSCQASISFSLLLTMR